MCVCVFFSIFEVDTNFVEVMRVVKKKKNYKSYFGNRLSEPNFRLL